MSSGNYNSGDSTSAGIDISCKLRNRPGVYSTNSKKWTRHSTHTSPSAAWFADPRMPLEEYWNELESYTLEIIRQIRFCSRCNSFRCETVLPNIPLARVINREFVDSAAQFAMNAPRLFLRSMVRIASSAIVSSCDCARCASNKFEEQRGFRGNNAVQSHAAWISESPDGTVSVQESERERTRAEISMWYAISIGALLQDLLFKGVFEATDVQNFLDETFVRLISMGCVVVALPLSFFVTGKCARSTIELCLQRHSSSETSLGEVLINRSGCPHRLSKNKHVFKTLMAIFISRNTYNMHSELPNNRCDICTIIVRSNSILERVFPLGERQVNEDITVRTLERMRHMYTQIFREVFELYGCLRDNPCRNLIDVYYEEYFGGAQLYVRALCDAIYTELLTDVRLFRASDNAVEIVTDEPCAWRPGPKSYHKKRRSSIKSLRVKQLYQMCE